MRSRSAIVGCLPHEYDGTFRETGWIVILMNPLKALMVAEALIRGAYDLLMLNHVRFFCYWRTLTWRWLIDLTYVCMNPALFRRSLPILPKKLSNSWKKPSDIQKKPSSLRRSRVANAFRKGVPNRSINFKDAYRKYSNISYLHYLFRLDYTWHNFLPTGSVIIWEVVYGIITSIIVNASDL